MLNTELFVERLIDQGYSHICVVPCSFAKNLINAVLHNKESIEYLPCANEAVACSIAAGLAMAGKRPLVVVQSSGLTNMGSCITSLLKPYEIKFPIIVSWRSYTSGDSEIQHQHLATALPDLITAYGYKYEALDNEDIDSALQQIDKCHQQQMICILQQKTFSTVVLGDEHRLDLSNYSKRSEYLIALNGLYAGSDTLCIGTTGNTAREMYAIMRDTKNLYMAGNMGGALSLGLGAALAGQQVLVCGGDAEFVMHLGGLTTAARYRNRIDLTYIVFDNESNKSTGGQNTFQQHLRYEAIVQGCGIDTILSPITNLHDFVQCITSNKSNTGMRFVSVKCDYDCEMPRPPLDQVKKNTFLNSD